MKPIAVVAADDPRLQITFDVPAESGSISVSFPRFDMVDEDELDAIEEGIAAVDGDLPAHKQQRQAYLVQMRPFLDDDQYAAVAKLKLGQLTYMMNTWTEKSAMSLGEYLASVESSTESTGKRSGRTSSTGAGRDET